MKAQIIADFNSLVSGTTGTEHNGVVGTPIKQREAVFNAFRTLFDKEVRVVLKGMRITLKATHSVSGKSTSYFSNLTRDMYIKIAGSNFGLSKKHNPYIIIQPTGEIHVSGGDKHWFKIPNNEITIL